MRICGGRGVRFPPATRRLTGLIVEDLYRRGARWLEGGALENPLLTS